MAVIRYTEKAGADVHGTLLIAGADRMNGVGAGAQHMLLYVQLYYSE